ncbi:hypothetical protein BDV28DRAFT_146127 [Aspergillus coremiiformis]|uniref:Mid2 domain-containing protein n=1 Tax=Aspergillus coremiiformis TaxID=138285 RepID=A0A5N6ZE38_9EURO|nr:hypothetical protein BDV28DRAFT_146127 [Aspergillus coremiiformis]
MFFPLWLIAILPFASQSLAICPSAPLPPPAYSPGGKFVYPNGLPSCFTQGSMMNISWETTYMAANLYVIHGAKYNEPIAIALNIASTWREWKVDFPGSPSDEYPFVFRLVDAQGSSDDQKRGGIWSTRFWILWPQDTSSSTTTQTLTTSSTMTTTPHTSVSTSSPSPTTSPDSNGGGSSQSKALSIGLGIGLGVPFCVAAAVLFLRWRKRTTHYAPFASPSSDQPQTHLTAPGEISLRAKPAYELSGDSARAQPGKTNTRYELD